MATIRHTGDYKHTLKYLTKLSKVLSSGKLFRKLDKYGRQGVKALQSATPVDSGKTAESWSYTIQQDESGNVGIYFCNSNVVNGWANVAILIEYGHATRGGGYVEGREYINPAIQPIFDKIAESAWKEVTGL